MINDGGKRPPGARLRNRSESCETLTNYIIITQSTYRVERTITRSTTLLCDVAVYSYFSLLSGVGLTDVLHENKTKVIVDKMEP